MKIADEIRDQLGVLWEKAHSGGLREHRKVKDVRYALSQILTLIDKENEAMRNINEGKLNEE